VPHCCRCWLQHHLLWGQPSLHQLHFSSRHTHFQVAEHCHPRRFSAKAPEPLRGCGRWFHDHRGRMEREQPACQHYSSRLFPDTSNCKSCKLCPFERVRNMCVSRQATCFTIQVELQKAMMRFQTTVRLFRAKKTIRVYRISIPQSEASLHHFA
jgi:hypothetical protein